MPHSRRHLLSLLIGAAFALAAVPALAGPDDDARFKSDGTTRNSVDPIVGGGLLADYPTNAEANSGLRIFPPTGTQLLAGQRFDLRVETQIPADKPPQLKSLKVNGVDRGAAFLARIAKQGIGLESGSPASQLLFGATARNLSFDKPGIYRVEAVVDVDGVERRIINELAVAPAPLLKGPRATKRMVFLLGDGMGLPIRTAARIYSKGVFEGHGRGALAMDGMDAYAMVHTASFDSIITDSAPGMASYVSGMKQANNALNVSADNTPENGLDNPRIETLWEYLKRRHGWRTGVVTDAFATDATPAATAAHTRARATRGAIAQQMLGHYRDGSEQPRTGYRALAELTQPLDVILGGGAIDWLARGNAALPAFYQYANDKGRKDGVDLYAEVAPSLGYSTVRDLDSLKAAPNGKPLLGIFAGEFRPTSSGLGPDNIPSVLDRLVARGAATIRGKGAAAPEIGMNLAPPFGNECGASVGECFRRIPSKPEMVEKAVKVLDTLAGKDGGWILLVEQSQTDKLAHILEYERTVYEAIELDHTLDWVLKNVAARERALVLLTADHAQPESIIGVVLPRAIRAGGATPPGGCFDGIAYPLLLGVNLSQPDRPCALQDAIGTFNDGTFPTYRDDNHDDYPDDPDPEVKLIIEDGGRPTYSTNYLTNYQPLQPSGKNAALPNPKRAPDGLLLTGNMPTRKLPGAAGKSQGNVGIAPHSADDVVLSVSGRGAGVFAGAYDNTDVMTRIAAALGGSRKTSDLKRGAAFVNVPAETPAGTALRGLE